MYAVVGKSTIQDYDEARKFSREEGIPRLRDAGVRQRLLGAAW